MVRVNDEILRKSIVEVLNGRKILGAITLYLNSSQTSFHLLAVKVCNCNNNNNVNFIIIH